MKEDRGGSQTRGNTAPKRYNYISIKIQEWISRSAPVLFALFEVREKEEERRRLKITRSAGTQLTWKFHVGLNLTAAAAV